MNGHVRTRAGWFVAALAAATLALAPAGALPPALAAVALTLVLAIVPGVLLARALAPDEASEARAPLALLLSPFASGVLMLLPRLVGIAAAPATRAFALVMALLSAWAAVRPKCHDTRAAAGGRGVWALAISAGVVLVLAHALVPALSARSDGSFHAGVVWAAARGVPPEDPFFAGLPLRYFWGSHAWASAWVALAPRLGAYAPLMVTSALAAVSALLAVGALARSLGGSTRVQLGAQALAMIGATPFAWLVLVARAASGEVRGRSEFVRALEHGADTALRSLDPGLLHPSLVMPLDKFVVLTPFAWGLAGAAVLALGLVRAVEAPGWRSALALGLAFGALLYMHPVAGLALGAALLPAVLLLAWAMPEARRALAAAGIAIACAVVLMAPYLLAVAGTGAGGGMEWGLALGPRGLVSVLVAGAFVLPAAGWWLARGGVREPGRSAVGGMLVALVAATCVLRCSGENQSKFLNLGLLLAAAPAAVAWSRMARTPVLRMALGALLLLALVPTLAAVGWAYAHESDASADAPSMPARTLVTAVRERLPADAWLVDATQDETRGAAPGLPGETGHALLWSGEFMARKWGYAASALELRQAAASALAHGRWPAGLAGELLRSNTREAWVITWDDSLSEADPGCRVMARTDGVVLARIARP